MHPLRFAKRAVLQILDIADLNQRFLNSAWWQRHLRIICWHGVSNDDEHAWNPSLFMTSETFRTYLELLRDTICNVLLLGEALSRLRGMSLQTRAACSTGDHGDSSLRLRAWPMLREFGFTATLYWTDYYPTRPFATLDPMLSFLLWKAQEKTLGSRQPTLRCKLRIGRERSHAWTALYEFSKSEGWTAGDKESLLVKIAQRLEADDSQIKSRRVPHLITQTEGHATVSEGPDLQLHTHRHRVPRNPDEFLTEIADNVHILKEVGAESTRAPFYLTRLIDTRGSPAPNSKAG